MFLLSNVYSQTNGLVAYYPFNGNAGDSSGLGNHGIASGVASTSDRKGTPNSAYYFDGIGAKIDVMNSSSIQPTNAITISAWIAPELKTNNGWNPIVIKRYAPVTDPYNSYALVSNPGTPYYNNWGFEISNGIPGTKKEIVAKTSTSYVPNTWTFIATTYDATTSNLKFYVNGSLDTTMFFSGNIGYSNLGLYIGYANSGINDYYKGKIDELRIYNRALANSEISNLFSPTSSISESFKEDNIHIFPNPFCNYITVKCNSAKENIVTIYDIAGNLVMSEKISDTQNIKTENLCNGFYVLNIQSELGTKSFKIIKQ